MNRRLPTVCRLDCPLGAGDRSLELRPLNARLRLPNRSDFPLLRYLKIFGFKYVITTIFNTRNKKLLLQPRHSQG